MLEYLAGIWEKRHLTNVLHWCDSAVPCACFTCHAFSGLAMRSDEMLYSTQHCSGIILVLFVDCSMICPLRMWDGTFCSERPQPCGSPIALPPPLEKSELQSTLQAHGFGSTLVWVCSSFIRFSISQWWQWKKKKLVQPQRLISLCFHSKPAGNR